VRFLSFPRYQRKSPYSCPLPFFPALAACAPMWHLEPSQHRGTDRRWVPCCHCILLAVRPLYRQSTQREEPDKVHMSAPPLLRAQPIGLLDAFAALVGLVFLVGLSALVGLAALVGLLLLVSLAESADLIRLIDLVALVPIVRSSLQLPQFPIECSRYRSGFRPAFQPSRFGGPLSSLLPAIHRHLTFADLHTARRALLVSTGPAIRLRRLAVFFVLVIVGPVKLHGLRTDDLKDSIAARTE